MKRTPLILGLLLLFGACGYQEGVVWRAEQSYLKFTGNWANASVQIDGMQPFILKPKEATESSPIPENTLYQLSPGRHRITVTRDGMVVVDRAVVMDNHVTMEVQIP